MVTFTGDEAVLIERAGDTVLSTFEEYSCAYVAGWLEFKCKDTISHDDDDDSLLTVEANCFIEEVSRGQLTVPHHSTYKFVRAGLWYLKSSPVKYVAERNLSQLWKC